MRKILLDCENGGRHECLRLTSLSCNFTLMRMQMLCSTEKNRVANPFNGEKESLVKKNLEII